MAARLNRVAGFSGLDGMSPPMHYDVRGVESEVGVMQQIGVRAVIGGAGRHEQAR